MTVSPAEARNATAQRTLWERMILALVASFALHLVLVMVIQGRPGQADALGAVPITARLEPAAAISATSEQEAPPVAWEDEPAAEAPAPERATPAEPSAGASKTAPAESGTAVEVPVIRDPTYYAARFLDEYPKPLTPVEPRYPKHAHASKLDGSVTLLLLIDEEGALNEITVVEAHPESVFDAAALAAFRGVRFSPARKDGRPVRSRVLITVGFEANDRSSER